MNFNLSQSIKYIRRDALAGMVTGIMAVPLTAGICLMSDYPIMTGLYTVIAACIIGFLSYLYRPGNFVGTPGVAAGLAPALALGVSSFGYENMPFVIFMTAAFQALVWKFKWERYILKVVPHYLVEGLLAGVGLKIGMKFIPFLYDIEHETAQWLNYERELILALSAVSFILFILLYKYYKKKMPALPYVVIMASSFALSFFLPLPRISIDAVPFELALPIPNFSVFGSSSTAWELLRMIGFALMLGSIDIIEQVMSNVAIEKLDPLKRKNDSNNSLQAIWVSNMAATFFGGMTNLDGLAKSTTNAVAGAVTKASNLFTALVLLGVVFYPEVLEHLPEYALGIIMVYSGYKMVANIANVRAEGRYALILAAVCGLLVFRFGIFEGLLISLATHGAIQYIFIRRLGQSQKDTVKYFRYFFRENKKRIKLESADIHTEPHVPVLDKWVSAVNNHDLDTLLKLYKKDSVVTPAFSTRIRINIEEIAEYYKDLFSKDDLFVKKMSTHLNTANGTKIDSGVYGIGWSDHGMEETHVLRFSAVIRGDKIIAHHTSLLPTGDVSIALWNEDVLNKADFIF